MTLIDMVELEDYTISVAAKELGIKLSTAKLIVSRFRKTGTVFRRKREQLQEKITKSTPRTKTKQKAPN